MKPIAEALSSWTLLPLDANPGHAIVLIIVLGALIGGLMGLGEWGHKR